MRLSAKGCAGRQRREEGRRKNGPFPGLRRIVRSGFPPMGRPVPFDSASCYLSNRPFGLRGLYHHTPKRPDLSRGSGKLRHKWNVFILFSITDRWSSGKRKKREKSVPPVGKALSAEAGPPAVSLFCAVSSHGGRFFRCSVVPGRRFSCPGVHIRTVLPGLSGMGCQVRAAL